jgi:hypothetical protein
MKLNVISAPTKKLNTRPRYRQKWTPDVPYGKSGKKKKTCSKLHNHGNISVYKFFWKTLFNLVSTEFSNGGNNCRISSQTTKKFRTRDSN